MADGKRKKKRRPGIRSILLLILLIVAAVIFILFQTGFELNIPNPFVKTTRSSASSIVLKQMRDLSRLNTIEFIYKSVFPHDLINSDIDMANLIRRYNNHERLSFEEIEMLSIYGITTEAGIDPGGTSFAVITVRIKAGFNFENGFSEEQILINPDTGSITLPLPKAEITEIIIEDDKSSLYEYPDLDVSPEQWKTLSSLLTAAAKKEAVERGILTEAEERGRQTIRRLLLNSGYKTVEFSS